MTDIPGGPRRINRIEMCNIVKRFPGVLANDKVCFDVGTGEVHALLGENGAGKSTLMRQLYGLYEPDEGEILIDGQRVSFQSPADAIRAGVGMIHQHFMLVPTLTVAENVALGLRSTREPVMDIDRVSARIGELAKAYGLKVEPDARVWQLSVGEQQRVEILKALYRGACMIILDEPTAVLTPAETQDLFENLRRLRADGKSIVFISHKLDEVLEIADRITVLRRGKVVGQTRPAETSKAKLAEMMVGRPVLFELEKPVVEAGGPVLELQGLVGGRLHGFDLTVHAGEIVGVAGVEGNGQRDLADAIMGLRPLDAGHILLEGEDLAGETTREIRNAGVGFIPEDRHDQGLVLAMTLWENTVLGRHDDAPFVNKAGVLSIKTIKELSRKLIAMFDVRARSIDVSAGALSGGNQQKLILARELETDPRMLLAAQPTRGLDVGAIEFVWRQILDQKAAGRAVLLISAELDEIYALSDRIVTLYEGRITAEYPPDSPAEEVGRGMLGDVAEKAAS